METMKEKLQCLYNGLYKKLNIDEKGCVGKRKFQNAIRMGENYAKGNPKILIVGLDAGSDNNKDFNKEIKFWKKIKIDVAGKINPHMAGVYGTVLYFQEDDKWKAMQETLRKSKTFQSFTKESKNICDEILSSFAIVNIYSFVSVGRERKSGDQDRVFINKKAELDHLISVIDTVNPDIVMVQSKSKSLKGYFKHIKKEIANKKTQIYIGYHPAVPGKYIKYRNPKLYFEEVEKI